MTESEFELLVSTKRADMVRIARARLRRYGLDSEAEDFVQSALLRIANTRENITLTEATGPFFVIVMIGLIKNRLVHLSQASAVETQGAVVLQNCPETPGNTRQERVATDVAAALDALPTDRMREAARLHYCEGWTHPEIARTFRVPLRTIERELATARDALRSTLAAYGPTKRTNRTKPSDGPADTFDDEPLITVFCPVGCQYSPCRHVRKVGVSHPSQPPKEEGGVRQDSSITQPLENVA